VLALAATAVLLAAADTYVVVLALPSIMNDVGIPISQLQQATPIISGFLLGYVVVLPLLGRLSDLYGRRPVFLGCLLAFAAGSVITASAAGLPLVVAGRTIQGLGGGGLVPVTLALVADLWPPGRRGLPLGAVGAVQELGSVLGPLYGAAVVSWSGWRAIFWINVALALALGGCFALASRASDGTTDDDARRPDAVGVLLLLGACGSGVLALVQPSALADNDTTGQLYGRLLGGRLGALTMPMALISLTLFAVFAGWEAGAARLVRPVVALRRLPAVLGRLDWPGAVLLASVLACIIVTFTAADPSRQVIADGAVITIPLAAGLAALFAWRERRAAEPLVDFRDFRAGPAAGALLVNLAIGAALMAALVDIPIFARATRFHDSQVQASLVLVRFLLAVPVGAILGGLVCERLSYRLTAAVGMALSAAMFAVMSGWGEPALAARFDVGGRELVFGTADLVLFACGLGFGLAIAPVNAALLAAVRGAIHGLASSLVVVARMIGMLTGLSLLTAIGLQRFYTAQAGIPSPLQLCPTHPASCPGYDSLVTAAVLDELHAIFIGAAACAAMAAALAIWLLRRLPGRARRTLADPLAAAAGAGG